MAATLSLMGISTEHKYCVMTIFYQPYLILIVLIAFIMYIINIKSESNIQVI